MKLKGDVVNALASLGLAVTVVAMAMASTLVQPLYCSTPAFQSALTRSPAAPSTSSKLTSWNVKRTSAFFGDSFYTRFAFRGAVKWRVAEERSMRRKAVGVVQAKRMESSADVATRAPDFQVCGIVCIASHLFINLAQ